MTEDRTVECWHMTRDNFDYAINATLNMYTYILVSSRRNSQVAAVLGELGPTCKNVAVVLRDWC